MGENPCAKFHATPDLLTITLIEFNLHIYALKALGETVDFTDDC